MRYLFLSILWSFIVHYTTNAQNVKFLDASNAGNYKVEMGKLKMGNPGPEGKKLEVNSLYLTLNGKPIIPVMGEVHFSRVPREQWEDVLLKMKACGVNIVASYVLWNYHEEIEGQFEWSGNKDLRAFAKLCAKYDLWFYPRVGPWCHAEVRNGATPDWILTKTNIKDRSNEPVYQSYTKKFFHQIGLQLKGLMYKDGGSVIGVQLENEYRKGKGGEAHIMWLKETVMECGFDVPLYTVTGWQNGSVPPFEVIPLWAAYPDAPWANHLDKNTNKKDFLFKKYRDTDAVGDNVQKNREKYIDYAAYPYFTCEIGVGNMNTNHRRLQIGSRDGLALIMAKMASGSNLPGYYMFTGGTNPLGVLTTLEENQSETGYYNANPIISYDFQAAINESGKLNGSYHEVKKLHYFLNEFGDRLAPMLPVFPEENSDFQYVVRSNGKSGFLFGSNYYRNNKLESYKGVQFDVKLENETVKIPSKSTTIADSAIFMWPINFELENLTLKYATAQPLCHLGNKWIFIEDGDVTPEFCFKADGIESVTASVGKIKDKDGAFLVKDLMPGKDCVITLKNKAGKEQKIIVLSKQEANNTWLLETKSGKEFFLSNSGMYSDGKTISAFGTDAEFSVFKLNESVNNKNIFEMKEVTAEKKCIQLDVKEVYPLENSAWLKTSAVEQLDSKNILNHRFFLKEFSLNNPSDIKRAQLLIYIESECNVQVNSRWVNQGLEAGKLNVLDLTGYVLKGNNKLMLEFPFEEGDKAFAAELEVEHFNTNRISFASDQSWLMRDSYTYPTFLTGYWGFKEPEQVQSKLQNQQLDFFFKKTL